MARNQQWLSVSGTIVGILVLLNGVIVQLAYTGNSNLYWLLLVTLPLLLLAIYNTRQRRHAILRNYPIIG